MSKKQILIDQIINIANGLTTDAINEVTDQLVSLEQKKIKEILSIISEIEMEELRLLYEELIEEEEIPVEVVISCYAHVGNQFDGIKFKNEPYINLSSEEGDIYDTMHLNSYINKYELLNNLSVKESYNLRKKKTLQINRLLKSLEEKYKISAETIFNYIVNGED